MPKSIRFLFCLSPTAVLAALTALETGALAALHPALHAPASAAPVSPLVTAKTIRVHEQLEVFDSLAGKFHPIFSTAVLISRPDKVKAVIAQVPNPGSQPHQYFAYGKTEYDDNATAKAYSLIKPQADGTSLSQFRDIAQIDLILGGGPKTPAADIRRTVTRETLNGRLMIVTTDTRPPLTTSDKTVYVGVEKTWVDAKTQLPYRQQSLLMRNGKASPQQVKFSGWVLNKPIPATELAWVPPAGSKLFAEP